MEYMSKQHMQKIVLSAALLLGANLPAVAGPSSMVAWDSETRNLVKSGNVEKGTELHKGCSSCHGDAGVAPSPNWPSLAGQLATYTFKQLKDYKGGQRKDGIMQAMSAPLSDQDMADLAAFYAAQPLPAPTGDAAGEAPVLVKKGDGKRLMPGCDLCHGRKGIGAVVDVPALAGQKVDYFIKTMKAFRDGKRGNDIYSRMRIIAHAMTDAEIEETARYYSSIAP